MFDVDLFVQNVKRYCKAKGVTPTVACREAGLSSNLVSVLEKRGSIPSVEKCVVLANYLGCTVNDLIGQATDPLHVWWDGLSDEQKHAIFVLTNTKM